MWPGDIIRALADVMPPRDDRHDRRRLAQVPVRPVLAEPASRNVLDVERTVGHGLRAERGDRREAGASGCAGAGRRRRRRVLDERQELETAERVGAPFITVVLEDSSYSLIKLAQENRKLEPYRMDFGPIDNVKMAEACGVQAMRTAEPDELAAAVKRAVERRKSLVVGRARALRRLPQIILAGGEGQMRR